jgi:hypothetical protein
MNLARFRPRFTVRRLMIAVLIVAVGIGGTREYQRLREVSREYNLRALRVGGLEAFFRKGAALSHEEWAAGRKETDRLGRESGWLVGYYPEPELCWRYIPYYETRRRNYERAARYPWLPVRPEPAPPAPIKK